MKHENPHREMGPAAAQPVPDPFAIPCRYLRSKEMYYQSFGEDDPYASGVYWCGKTQEGFGPDGQSCDKENCSSKRPCYLM